jgi:hypothetical protein
MLDVAHFDMKLPPNPGANRRWRGQFRCRGQRHEYGVARLGLLGIM